MKKKSPCRPSNYRYISYFYLQYRVMIPIPHKKEEIQVYIPVSTSLYDIERLIIRKMKENNVQQDEMNYLMDGWPNKYNAIGKVARKHINLSKSNISGYLGVACKASLKSIAFDTCFYNNGEIVRGERFSVKMHPSGEDFFVRKNALLKAFAYACKEADKLRGKRTKTLTEYKKHFSTPGWKNILDKVYQKRYGNDCPFELLIKD